MKKKSFVLLILLVLISVLSVGCFDGYFNGDNNNGDGSSGGDGNTTTEETVDYASIINNITLNVMQANFKVVVAHEVSFVETDFAIGSGAIIKREESTLLGETEYTYTLLTNNHVVASGTFTKNIFYVEDYCGERIEAEVIVRSANYDLAVVEFTSTDKYEPLSFNNSPLKVGDAVFAIGTPQFQINAVTIGKILDEIAAPDSGDENSTINFNVIKHDAVTKEGSSGGVLLNENLKIVAINYAGIMNADTGEFIASVSIPVSRVKQFLTNNGITI